MAFDGDCANVLTPEQVESILGVGAVDRATWISTHSPAPPAPDVNPEATLGGLECRWVAAEGADLPEGMLTIGLFVLPAEVVVDVDFSEPLCQPVYDSNGCRMSRAENGVWLMAHAGGNLEAPPVAQLEAALTHAAANLASFPPPTPAAPEPARWDLPECDDIAARIGLSEFIGADFQSGFWEGSPQPEHELLEDAGASRLCPWYGALTEQEFHIVTLEIMPGGAVWWDDVATHPGVTPVAVPGAQDAVLVGEVGSQTAVLATDGVNVLHASTGDGHADDSELVVTLAERALAALNEP